MNACVKTDSIKVFSASHVALPVIVLKKMERISARTVDPRGVPNCMMGLALKTGGRMRNV